jgi:hypothetical protein
MCFIFVFDKFSYLTGVELELECLCLCPGADWPNNEVGKIPRGPSRLGAPQHHDLFFFLDQLNL